MESHRTALTAVKSAPCGRKPMQTVPEWAIKIV